jgi:RNA polymerase sigma-70 factor (ECF subfamily)
LTNETTDTDKELFRLIAEGDEQAFSACVHRFTPQLFPYIKSMVQEDLWAEDLLQNLFIKLWKNKEKLSTVEKPGGYLNRMAANLAVDFMRCRSVELKAQYRLARQLETFGSNPGAENFDRRIYERFLQRAVDQLTPQQQKAFRLRHIEQLSYQEIGVRMGISSNTVRNHLVASMASLRIYLKKHLDIILTLVCFFGNP